MRLRDRTFGIEIEFSQNLIQYGSSRWEALRRYLRKSRLLSKGYRAVMDTSCGGEVVSPILTWKDWKDVETLCSYFNRIGKKYGVRSVDENCSFHVHMEASDFTHKQIRNAILMAKISEIVLFRAFPEYVISKRYCLPVTVMMKQLLRTRDMIDIKDLWFRCSNQIAEHGQKNQKIYTNDFYEKPEIAAQNYDKTRYHGLNLVSLFKNNQTTLEFRYHTGTMNHKKMRLWVEFCQRFMHAAKICGNIHLKPEFVKNSFEQLFLKYEDPALFQELLEDVKKICDMNERVYLYIIKRIRKYNPALLFKFSDLEKNAPISTKEWNEFFKEIEDMPKENNVVQFAHINILKENNSLLPKSIENNPVNTYIGILGIKDKKEDTKEFINYMGTKKTLEQMRLLFAMHSSEPFIYYVKQVGSPQENLYKEV